MNITKAVVSIACAIVAVVTLIASVDAGAQSVPFKVVAIKRNTTGATSAGVKLRPGGRIVITNTPLRDVIRYVFSLPAVAVLGGPDWLASERYDIVAEAEANRHVRSGCGSCVRSVGALQAGSACGDAGRPECTGSFWRAPTDAWARSSPRRRLTARRPTVSRCRHRAASTSKAVRSEPSVDQSRGSFVRSDSSADVR